MVGPGFGDDLEGHDAGGRLVGRRVLEQARLRQARWKRRQGGCRLVGSEFLDRSVAMVEQQEFAIAILCEGHHANLRVGQIPPRPGRVAGDIHAPEPSGLPVTKHVAAHEFGKPPAPIDEAPRHGGGIGMRDLEVWAHDLAGPPRPVGVERIAAVHDAPAAVVAGPHPADPLRAFEAHVAHPQLPRLPVEAHLPGIAEAEGEDFASRSRHVHERVVGRNGIGPVAILPVHVDPQDRGQQVAHVLSGPQPVGRLVKPAVAGGDVETAIGAEDEATTVMSSPLPGE